MSDRCIHKNIHEQCDIRSNGGCFGCERICGDYESSIESELEQLQTENQALKNKIKDLERNIINLEIEEKRNSFMRSLLY